VTTPPEGATRATVRPASPADWRRDHTFTPPPRVPWSQLGPQFALAFGHADPADPQPEHIEIIGQNGSGKTHAAGKIYQERAFVRERPSIIFATKPADATLAKIGFPVAESWKELTKLVRDGHQNVIFWARTNRMGHARRAWHDAKISDVLNRLWVPESDTDVVIDDWGYAEQLPEVSGILEQYLREGRSSGLSVGALKQRPQGSTRLMTSETQWTLGFRPKDDSDLERWAQLFGARQDWMPVFRDLDQTRREFVLKHAPTQVAYISWIDEPLAPVELPRKRRGLADLLRIGNRRQ
jgi:hypothetical protein